MTGSFAPLVAGGVGVWLTPLLAGALAVIFGAASINASFDNFGTSNAVKNTPTERIRSMAVGRTELTGTARPDGELHEQPLSDGQCAYGEFRIRELDHRGSEPTWNTIEKGRVGEHVVLEDGTGSVLLRSPPIDFSDACVTRRTQGRLATAVEGTFLGDWLGVGPDQATRSLLEDRGVPVISARRRQYEQRVIPPETELYVLGHATIVDDEAAEATLERLQERYPDLDTNVLMEHRSRDVDYYVTDKTEEQVASEQHWSAMKESVGGIALLVFGIALLVVGIVLF